jgi:hypothetical protein
VCAAGYLAWQACWRQRREEAEAAMAAKRAMTSSARKKMVSQPSQPRVFINLNGDSPSTSGGAGH